MSLFFVLVGRRLFVYHPPTAGSALPLYPAFLRKGIHSTLHSGSGNTEFHCQTDLSRLGIRAKLLDDANPQRRVGLRISLISLRISLIEANLSQRQDHCRAVWPERLFDAGNPKAAIPPCRIDVRDPASSPFADLEQIPHLHDSFVPRIGDAAFDHLRQARANGTGVLKDDSIGLFDNDQPSRQIKVRVGKAVGQRLAERLVQRGVVNAIDPLQFERLREIARRLAEDAKEKVEHIGAPIAGLRLNPIGPSECFGVFHRSVLEYSVGVFWSISSECFG